jgi:asparagine synthase (glutamine-hydrolysing)
VWGAAPKAVQNLAWNMAQKLPTSAGYMSLDFKVKTFLKGAQYDEPYRHQAWIGSFTPDAVQELLTPAWRSPNDPLHDVYAPVDAFLARTRATGLDRALRYYVHTYMKDDILVKVDRASMAASLEVRAPFLDRELARWVLTLPTALKLRGVERKWLLKRALRGVVPDLVLDRKKHGFALPVAAWLRGPLLPLLHDLLGEPVLKAQGIFEPKAVRTLVDEHARGTADHRKPLWTLLMFELWRRRWLKR